MTKCIDQLLRAGITYEHATGLRRIAMALHRWHELECGTDSGAVERDEKTGKTYWVNSYSGSRWPCRDREKGALKRLKLIMKNYPHLRAYVQGDPRGASLYILRENDVPPGENVDSYYSRGLAVYK
jgi:hypothetical protein